MSIRLKVLTNKPSQHTMSDQYRWASKKPFKWHFAGGQTLSCFFMFSFDVSFDIMRKITIIFSDKHFWCSKESSRWDGSFEHQNLTLKRIENTILHTTLSSVRSSVRTITLKENRIIKKNQYGRSCSTLFFLKNLFFQLIHGLTWQVDVIKNAFTFVLKLLIVSQMQILDV